ncbi:tetratricopeptide repeat protein [Botryobacter ruber]|uniref:tetratricopeptide repeat protein n=1 Tax=Botryobacter ruber TaxID=2171629 RepID=UPI000E0A7CCB|nr:tetratricopeptide repeat protein [Botryobacter ruber]
MNKSAFLELIQQVSGITDQQTDELEKVAAAFPYCQTAHLLLAKSAYDKGSMLSSQRLRSASSYATDRKLLKKIIYAVPSPPVPVYQETEQEEQHEPELLQNQEPQEQETAAEAMVTAAAENPEPTEAPEPANEPVSGPENQEEEQVTEETAGENEEELIAAEPAPATPEPASSETTEGTAEPTAAEAPEESVYSELAMLLTINSLSSSSTDLLIAKPDKTTVAPAPIIPELLHANEDTPDTAETEAGAGEEAEEAPAETSPAEQEDSPEDEMTVTDTAAAAETAATSAENQEEQPFGEVNYSSDEIDRLYAEDALGYWMGSSRMGEVLQLKDDYTRQKPQSFHPELILEYSKTHELEKAIQPTTNVLSTQLDIIDQFLKLNPRLKTMANLKLKPEPQEDLSLKSTRIRKGMASENLASIFLKQGKVKKAVKIYEQLILKYPEKKAYFAEQIEKLQNLN